VIFAINRGFRQLGTQIGSERPAAFGSVADADDKPGGKVKSKGAFRIRPSLALLRFALRIAIAASPITGLPHSALAQHLEIAKTDYSIEAVDPGIKLLLREKMAAGNSKFDDNIVLFLHGATSPSTCDFDLPYQDYSWADWLAKRGYVVYMGDYRNYGGSTREAGMDEPASNNQPLTRSYLALRDYHRVRYRRAGHDSVP
jgi:hypothetical protein